MGDRRRESSFFGRIKRTLSLSRGGNKLEKERRASEGNILRRRGTDPYEGPPDDDRDYVADSRRRTRRIDPRDAKGKGIEVRANGRMHALGGPLTEWPPAGMRRDDELTFGHAMELVATGVPNFRGYKRPIPHASDHYFALYATAAGNRGDQVDAADSKDTMTRLMTMRLQGAGPAEHPWETLEQFPSYQSCYGRRAGTITLNQWVNLSSALPPPLALQDSGVLPRDVDLTRIFKRLKQLERYGLEEDDEEAMYKSLYGKFLRDPEKLLNRHKTLDKQITDLILVLSRPDWIDFTNIKNQIVTKFIFDTSPARHQTYLKFFHQLLLSVELHLRISSKYHSEESKERLMKQIPPTIQWDLALARRWSNVRIDEYGPTADSVRLRFKLKKHQITMIKRFAQMMKWPNLDETLRRMRERDEDGDLPYISSDTMAFFSGLVLPGPTFPYLIMNSIIDIDPDRATDKLAFITPQFPQIGFQHRNSYTYWTASCIVGKVLAPTCLSAGGWVGPARPSQDLDRSQITRIRCRRPRQRLTPEDVASMSERSTPLGPPPTAGGAQVYPVSEYTLPSPDTDDLWDAVRIELLALRPCPGGDRASSLQSSANGTQSPAPSLAATPRLFDASIQFAIDGVSWPLRLTFDVSFVSAWPCTDGPHPLFFDYGYTAKRAEELVKVRDWNGLYGGHPVDRSARSSPAVGPGMGPSSGGKYGKGGNSAAAFEDDAQDKVLVVEAFGVPDNEVLARAWCSHWGLSAVVADVNQTCLSCAVREAYAATLTVVILVDDDQNRGREN